MTQTVENRIKSAVQTKLEALVTAETIVSMSVTSREWWNDLACPEDGGYHVGLIFLQTKNDPITGFYEGTITVDVSVFIGFDTDIDALLTSTVRTSLDGVTQAIDGAMFEDRTWGELAIDTEYSTMEGAESSDVVEGNQVRIYRYFDITFHFDPNDPTKEL